MILLNQLRILIALIFMLHLTNVDCVVISLLQASIRFFMCRASCGTDNSYFYKLYFLSLYFVSGVLQLHYARSLCGFISFTQVLPLAQFFLLLEFLWYCYHTTFDFCLLSQQLYYFSFFHFCGLSSGSTTPLNSSPFRQLMDI